MGVSENRVYPNGYVHMESDENSLDFWVPYFQTNPFADDVPLNIWDFRFPGLTTRGVATKMGT